MWNNKIKGILTLISSILIQLLIGNLFSFSNFIPYYKSYLYHKNNDIEKISELQLYFIAPSGIFVHNTFPSVTGFLDKILGTRILTIIGVISLLGSQLIMYFFTDYYLLIISYILFGFCGSLTYFQSLKNSWKYFPNKKGLISGIIFSCFGLSSFIFTTIADLIINPDSIEKEKDGYYKKEISDKFLDYIKFYTICVGVMGAISALLSFPYKEELNEENNNYINEINEKKEEDIDINKEKEDINEAQNNYNTKADDGLIVGKGENKENIDDEELSLKEVFKSTEFFKCLIVAGCTLFYGFLLSNTYRNFGIEKNLSDSGMQILSKAFTLINTFSRLLWGFICDKFGFKIPYIIVCINQIISGSLIYFASSNLYFYFTVVCLGVLSYAGHIVLYPNLVHIKFGVNNSVIILGIFGIFAGIVSILGPILTLFILKKDDKDKADDNIKNYLFVYLIGMFPTIISLILTIFIKVEKMKKKVENNIDNIDKEALVNRSTVISNNIE